MVIGAEEYDHLVKGIKRIIPILELMQQDLGHRVWAIGIFCTYNQRNFIYQRYSRVPPLSASWKRHSRKAVLRKSRSVQAGTGTQSWRTWQQIKARNTISQKGLSWLAKSNMGSRYTSRWLHKVSPYRASLPSYKLSQQYRAGCLYVV